MPKPKHEEKPTIVKPSESAVVIDAQGKMTILISKRETITPAEVFLISQAARWDRDRQACMKIAYEFMGETMPTIN